MAMKTSERVSCGEEAEGCQRRCPCQWLVAPPGHLDVCSGRGRDTGRLHRSNPQCDRNETASSVCYLTESYRRRKSENREGLAWREESHSWPAPPSQGLGLCFRRPHGPVTCADGRTLLQRKNADGRRVAPWNASRKLLIRAVIGCRVRRCRHRSRACRPVTVEISRPGRDNENESIDGK